VSREKWGKPRTFRQANGYVSEVGESIIRAEADLVDALDGVELDASEERMVDWLMNWDQPTLHTIASIVRKARATGPQNPEEGTHTP
jgi:hypothetical protein